MLRSSAETLHGIFQFHCRSLYLYDIVIYETAHIDPDAVEYSPLK